MDVVAVVGASLAGLRAVEELRAAGYPGDIVVIGAEAHPPYDRPPLTKNALTEPVPLDRLRLGRERPGRRLGGCWAPRWSAATWPPGRSPSPTAEIAPLTSGPKPASSQSPDQAHPSKES
jgi:hypothetical protein